MKKSKIKPPLTIIKPRDINTSNHFWNAFGNMETEVSAWYIVKLCQEKGGWKPFTKAELDKISGENFWFNRLSPYNPNHKPKPLAGSPIYIIEIDDKYHVTALFIAKCYAASPK